MLQIVAAIAGTIFFTAPQAAPQKDVPLQRIVAASNVRLRSAAQPDADILTGLSIGTVVTQVEASADMAWFRVQAPDGKTGWVFANLTEPFSHRDSVEAYRHIIQSRLKAESLSFADASDLFQFVDRIVPQIQDPDRAEFDLFRLRAL